MKDSSVTVDMPYDCEDAQSLQGFLEARHGLVVKQAWTVSVYVGAGPICPSASWKVHLIASSLEDTHSTKFN